MQKTYILTVTTEDGKCLIQETITGTLSSLRSLLLHLSSRLVSRLEDSEESEISPGSGTLSSAWVSSSPTDS